MITEKNLFEQLDQIYKEQPVDAGNISYKQAKDELVKRGWVMWYEDGGTVGYVCTEVGRKAHGAFLLAQQSAVNEWCLWKTTKNTR